MAAIRKRSSVKRFGARYGLRVKTKVGKIEAEQRKLHKCPFCSKEGVKRVSYGIWECKKCGAKFSGRAYTPSMSVAKEETAAIAKDETVEQAASE